MAQYEQALLEIFSYYTVTGHALTPFHISHNSMTKMCEDCGLFDSEAFPNTLTGADVYFIFYREGRHTPENKRCSGQPPTVSFPVFVRCVSRIAERLYANTDYTPEEAMNKLLRDHLLRKAKRRITESVRAVLESQDVRRIYHHLMAPLTELVQYYSKQPTHDYMKRVNGAGGRSSPTTKRAQEVPHGMFDGAGARVKALQQRRVLEQTLGYDQYLRLAREVGCGGSVCISAVELAEAYLSAALCASEGDCRLTVPQLWECVVRWGLVARKDSRDVPPEDRIKSLLLDMCHHAQDRIASLTVYQFSTPACAASGNKARLIKACHHLIEGIHAMWAEDGFRVYLEPDAEEAPHKAHVMGQMKTTRFATLSPRALKSPASKERAFGAPDSLALEVEGVGEELLADPDITVAKLNKLLSTRPEFTRVLQRALMLPAA